MKKILIPALTISVIASSLNAQTSLSFTDLNSAFNIAAGNTLQVSVDGGAAGTTGLSVSGAASGDNFLYTVTYTGADYNNDMINDTLTFGVLVEGWENGLMTYGTVGNNSDSSATIGTDSTQVVVNAADHTWNPSNLGRIETNESLQFSLTPFDVVLTGVGSGTAVSAGFTQVFMDENAGSGHRSIFGEGDNLDGNTYNNNLNKTLSASYGTGDLFVNGLAGGNSGKQLGARGVGFDITVIPEPGTYALFAGLTGVTFVMLRRRRG